MRALVTGGTRGLGRAVADALVARGDEVVVTYAGNEEAAADARAAGITAHRCDAADAAQVAAFFQTAGDFDLVVHAAGFTRDKLMMMMPEADFDAVVDVHLKGGFLVTKHAMKGMIAKRKGRIVFVVSPTALVGRPGQTSYGAAKAGLIGLGRSLAREVARFQITVNCVSAGLVETGLTESLSPEARAEIVRGIPLGRTGRPEEIASVVTWLAGDGAGYITGQVISADGGIT